MTPSPANSAPAEGAGREWPLENLHAVWNNIGYLRFDVASPVLATWTNGHRDPPSAHISSKKTVPAARTLWPLLNVKALAALLAAPLILIVSIAGLAANAASTNAAAAAAAAAACTYGNPDPERIAIAMEQLGDPVNEDRYNTYASDAGIDPAAIAFQGSTSEQRHTVVVTAIRTLTYTVTPRTVASPVVAWWGADLRVDDTDTTWQNHPVAGYGTLGDYIVDYLNAYAADPIVLASVSNVSCTPAGGRCQAPEDISPILETIRYLESRGDYTAQAAGSSASGAYQFVDGTWDNFAGYPRAVNAPPTVQDKKATAMVITILERNSNDVAAVPVVWYIGHVPDPDSPAWDTIPVPDAGNVLTPREYPDPLGRTVPPSRRPGRHHLPDPEAIAGLAGPDCDGLQGNGATYNGKLNGTLDISDLPSSPWGPLQPAAAAAWSALVDAGIADGWSGSDFAAWSGGPGSRNGGSSNHTIGLALDINQLAWTPTRSIPAEPLPVAVAFDQRFYQWMRTNAWRYGWCNPQWARPLYLNGSAAGGKDAAGRRQPPRTMALGIRRRLHPLQLRHHRRPQRTPRRTRLMSRPPSQRLYNALYSGRC